MLCRCMYMLEPFKEAGHGSLYSTIISGHVPYTDGLTGAYLRMAYHKDGRNGQHNDRRKFKWREIRVFKVFYLIDHAESNKFQR